MGRVMILLDDRGRRHALRTDGSMSIAPGLGTLETSRVLPRIGRRLDVGGRSFLVLEASMRDLRETMERGPQTLAPKDIAPLLYEADIRAGATVLEAGSGSGGLTVALANAVGPAGKVISLDMRQDLQQVARRNVEAAGVLAVVDFRHGDVRRGVPDRHLDAVLLDMEDPWSAVSPAWDALRTCGHLATFSPNMEQVKETVATVRAKPFVDVRTIEVIEREMEVRDVGVRPSFAALGHTGYLTFARKVLETF